MMFQFHGQMKKVLGHIEHWFDKAETHAKLRGFDVDQFVSSRLAPDQWALNRQVQSACDTAKLGASRLTGKEAPSHADTETTIAELRARVKSTIAYLDGFKGSDYDGANERLITTPRWEGKVMTGADYLMEHVMPNFYFHTGHTYAILRHNGVDVGKRDFLGAQTRRDP